MNLFNPLIFNYLIMALYTLNAVQFAFRRMWGDAAYWASAFCITASVTWGFNR